MLAIERHQKIKKLLIKNQHVDVSSLSKIFNVTEVTIRRDLDKLERQGALVKIHGGAVLSKSTCSETQFGIDTEENNLEIPGEKNMIGIFAGELIEDNSTVFLSAGSICPFIVNNIKDKKKLTIITNDMNIAFDMVDFSGIKVVLTGGELIEGTTIMAGPRAIDFIKGSYIKTAFIEVGGIDLAFGYTIDNYEEAQIYDEVLACASTTYVLADYTKFGKITFNKLFSKNPIGNIITNSNIPDEYKKFLYENYIKIFTTYEFEKYYHEGKA